MSNTVVDHPANIDVRRHSSLPASQILTVQSGDADASRVESCKKAAELAQLLWYSPLPASQVLAYRGRKV